MSLHFELVIAIHLRDGLADTDIAEARWHLGLGSRPDRPRIHDGPLLGQEGISYLPGGDITILREGALGSGPDGPRLAWGLFVRRFMVDDTLYEIHTPLCEWLAAVAVDGYAGFWREEDETWPNVLIVRKGHTYIVTPSGDMEAATPGAPRWAGP